MKEGLKKLTYKKGCVPSKKFIEGYNEAVEEYEHLLTQAEKRGEEKGRREELRAVREHQFQTGYDHINDIVIMCATDLAEYLNQRLKDMGGGE